MTDGNEIKKADAAKQTEYARTPTRPSDREQLKEYLKKVGLEHQL